MGTGKHSEAGREHREDRIMFKISQLHLYVSFSFLKHYSAHLEQIRTNNDIFFGKNLYPDVEAMY